MKAATGNRSGKLVRALYPRARHTAGSALRFANRNGLASLERFCGKRATLRWSPLFIIGAPRCGSTLTMQLIVDAFDVGYLSNCGCWCFGFPALAERIQFGRGKRQPSRYTSKHGRTSSPEGPSECGAWWYRFFPHEPAFVRRHEVTFDALSSFSQSVALLEQAFGRPLVFKNLYASLRIDAIVAAIPNAMFLVVKRNENDNAVSILASRRKATGREDRWWSVPPPGLDKLRSEAPEVQVLAQIRAIHKQIRTEVERLQLHDRVLWLDYETLCDDVPASLDMVSDWTARVGAAYAKRFDVPLSFERSDPARREPDTYARVVGAEARVRELFP